MRHLRARSVGSLFEQSIELEARVVGQATLCIACNISHCAEKMYGQLEQTRNWTHIPARLNVLRRAASFLFFASSIVPNVVVGDEH